MTIEEKRGIIGGDGGPGEKFPIGMRVLAVDDDPICLKVLETLLIRCQYNVTTTNQAIKALNMLRENKAKFDLVISDVHMPDMDGFKLLELVGLEMDLPVIMLSANGETKAVMKGIAHGACDYLLKPVRIEELKNIWQHVVRRKNFDQIERSGLNIGKDFEKVQAANSEVTKAFDANRPIDSNTKFNKKRKDLNIEDEDDFEDDTHESEDPSCQKKPRVVWSVELHRKFVAAVNQLGVDKAVPKRILDIMNVDKLTRENVASHLQKYRLYLKRLSAVTTQQANLAVSLGGREMPFMHMGSFNNCGTSQALTTFQPIVVSNRTNPNLLGPPRVAPGMVQLGQTQNNMNNPVNDISKFQHISVPVNQRENFFEGIPISLELDHLQQQPKRINESNSHLQGVFSDASYSNFISSTNNSLLLQGNQSPVSIPSSVANRHEMSPVISARFLDLAKRGESWQNAPSLNAYSGDSLLAGTRYSNDNLTSSNTRATLASTVLQIPGNPSNSSSNNLVVTIQNSLVGQDVQCQTNSEITDPNFLSFKIVEQKSTDSKQRCTLETNIAFSSSSNSTFTNQTLLNNVAESQGFKNQSINKKFDINVMSQPSSDTAFNTQYGKTDKSNFYNGFTFSEDNLFGVSKMQGGFGSGGCNFDDLMNEMIKTERDDIGFIVDGEISSDLFYLSTVL